MTVLNVVNDRRSSITNCHDKTALRHAEPWRRDYQTNQTYIMAKLIISIVIIVLSIVFASKD